MSLSHRFDAALRLAHDIHRHQTRKTTGVPYIAHVMGVATLTLEYGGGENEAIGALLHDAIEDAPSDLGADGVRTRILEGFGPAVLDIVEHCTDAEVQPKPPWLARKTAYLARLPHAPEPALLVSAADKLYNASAILRDFRSVGDAVWMRFNPDAGKSGTIGYYRALADAYARTFAHRITADVERIVAALEREAGHSGGWPPQRR